MFSTLLAIARNTFIESIRQPIFTVMLGIGLGGLAFNLAFTAYTLGDDTKLMIDMGLSWIYLCGLFLAAFTAAGVVCREIENRTALTVISKPIARAAFVLGKYLGVTGAIGLAFYLWSLGFLMSVRHQVVASNWEHADWPVILFGTGALGAAILATGWGNYFYGWVFSSRFAAVLGVLLTLACLALLLIGKKWEIQPLSAEFAKDDGLLAQVMIALGLLMLGLAVLSAVAVAASTRLGQVMTLVVCAAIFLVGLSSDYLIGRMIPRHPIAWIAYAAAPNMQYLWLADALTQRNAIGAEYVMMTSAYTGCYIAAVLCIGVAMFQTRETG